MNSDHQPTNDSLSLELTNPSKNEYFLNCPSTSESTDTKNIKKEIDVLKETYTNNRIIPLDHNKSREIKNGNDSFDVFLPNRRTQKFKMGVHPNKRKSPYFNDIAGMTSHLSKKERDPDLELAIALSLSSGNHEISPHKIKSKSAHLARKKGNLKKLSSVPPLLRRTKEEREKIVTEKVAIVLIDNKSDENQVPFISSDNNALISNHLQNEVDKRASLWKMSQMNLNGVDINKFLVKSLIKYDSPTHKPPTNEDMVSQKQNLNAQNNEDMPEDTVDYFIPSDAHAEEVLKTTKNLDDSNKTLQINRQVEVNECGDKPVCNDDDLSDDKTLEYPNSHHSPSPVNPIHDESTVDCFDERPNSVSRTEKWADEVNLFRIKNDFENLSLKILSDDLEKLMDISEPPFNVYIKTGGDKYFVISNNILYARCPKLFKEIEHYSVSLEKYPSKVCQCFCKYLLTGKIDQFENLTSAERQIMTEISIKYELNFLKQVFVKLFNCQINSNFRYEIVTENSGKHFSLLKELDVSEISKSFKDIIKREQSPDLFLDSESNDANYELNLSKQSRKFFLREKSPEKPPCIINVSSDEEDNEPRIISSNIIKPNKNTLKQARQKLKTSLNKCFTECITIEDSESSSKEEQENNEYSFIDTFVRNELEHSFTSPYPTTNKTGTDLFNENSSSNSGLKELDVSEISKTQSQCDDEFNDFGNIPYHSPIYPNSPEQEIVISSTPNNQNHFQESFPLLRELSPNPESSPEQKEEMAEDEGPSRKEENPKSDHCSTPGGRLIRVSDTVTPHPNYEMMVSPDIKKELRKYGIKESLNQRKAVSLLQYIYDQIHPNRHDPVVKKILHQMAVPGPSGICSKKKLPNELVTVESSDSSDSSSM